MANPQQPELARSRKTPHQDQDSVESRVGAQRPLGADAPPDVVPPENRPGHHPDDEQDKPDLDAFAERLGVAERSDGDGAAGGAGRDDRETGPAGVDERPTDLGPAVRGSGRPVRVFTAGAGLVAVAAVIVRTRRRSARR